MPPQDKVLESKTDMERQARLQAAERLLAILDRNAAGLSPEERERKWKALETAIDQSGGRVRQAITFERTLNPDRAPGVRFVRLTSLYMP